MAHRYCVRCAYANTESEIIERTRWKKPGGAGRGERGLRIESEEERNGAQLCRGTSGSVVALSKAHKFPNRWKMHFSNRAPGRFAQVDSLADPKNTLLFTVSLHLCTRESTSTFWFSVSQSVTRYRASFNFRWIEKTKTCSNFLQLRPT